MLIRPWDDQTFVEAMGEVWNNVEGQDHPKETCCGGGALNYWIVFVNVCDWVWWWFGFVAVCASDTAICSDRVTFVAGILVGYQAINVHCPSFMCDLVIPYFSMEVKPLLQSMSWPVIITPSTAEPLSRRARFSLRAVR